MSEDRLQEAKEYFGYDPDDRDKDTAGVTIRLQDFYGCWLIEEVEQANYTIMGLNSEVSHHKKDRDRWKRRAERMLAKIHKLAGDPKWWLMQRQWKMEDFDNDPS